MLRYCVIHKAACGEFTSPRKRRPADRVGGLLTKRDKLSSLVIAPAILTTFFLLNAAVSIMLTTKLITQRSLKCLTILH
jgi:hypothetical protein